MVESNFQFTNPAVSSVNFYENKDFKIQEGKQIDINTSIKQKCIKLNDLENEVGILIEIGDNTNNYPFSLRLEMVANFKFADETPEETKNKLLNQNAPALLLSYARPIVAMITNASHYPAYNIPFMNFVGLKENK